MSQDTDGINDALDGATRIAVTLASQMAARLARERERAAREARGRSEADAREMHGRFSAERAAARAQFALVERDAWWDTASPKQVGDVLQVAVMWQAVDARAAAAVAVINRQVQQRHGVTPDRWLREPDGASGSSAVAGRQAAESTERSEAGRILANPDISGPASAVDERRGFDSSDRRRQRADRLRVQGHDTDAVAAVLSADVSQARPASHAVVPAAAFARHSTVPSRLQDLELQQ